MRLQSVAIVLTAILAGQPCVSRTAYADPSGELQARIGSIQNAMRNRKVARVEILSVPPRIETDIAITSAALEKQPEYRLIIRDISVLALREKLSKALDTVIVTPSSELGDYRWGVVFYDDQGKRIMGIFFAPDGRHGAIDSATALVDGQLYRWLTRTYADCFQ